MFSLSDYNLMFIIPKGNTFFKIKCYRIGNSPSLPIQIRLQIMFLVNSLVVNISWVHIYGFLSRIFMNLSALFT